MRATRIAGFVLLAAAWLSATTIVPMSVEQLTRESGQVVDATALESWTAWNSQHSMIFTFTRFAVSSRLKGQAADTLVVRQPGGSAGGYTTHVAGVRHWNQGERAVLFLRPSVSDGAMEVTGLMQGNFLVTRDAQGNENASNGVPGVTSYQPASQQVSGYRGSVMKLSDLKARIQKAAQP